MSNRIVPIRLEFENTVPASNINLTIITPEVGWSIGSDSAEGGGINLAVASNYSNVISHIGISYSVISLSTCGDKSSALGNFILSLFLNVEDDVKFLKGAAVLSPSTQVHYHINNEKEGTWANGIIDAAW